jgi:hypothetical protein
MLPLLTRSFVIQGSEASAVCARNFFRTFGQTTNSSPRRPRTAVRGACPRGDAAYYSTLVCPRKLNYLLLHKLRVFGYQ